MQLYGAKVSQKYIQLTDGKKRLKYRYPNSTQYPHKVYDPFDFTYRDIYAKINTVKPNKI